MCHPYRKKPIRGWLYTKCLKNETKYEATEESTVLFYILQLFYSAVKKYRITCSNPVDCSFSASVNFQEKQSLCDYMHSSMLYPITKSDFLMPVLSLRKQIFSEISHFLPVKNCRINIVVALFLQQGYLSFVFKLHIRRQKGPGQKPSIFPHSGNTIKWKYLRSI